MYLAMVNCRFQLLVLLFALKFPERRCQTLFLFLGGVLRRKEDWSQRRQNHWDSGHHITRDAPYIAGLADPAARMRLLRKYRIHLCRSRKFSTSCSPWKSGCDFAWKRNWWLAQAHTHASAFARHTCQLPRCVEGRFVFCARTHIREKEMGWCSCVWCGSLRQHNKKCGSWSLTG